MCDATWHHFININININLDGTDAVAAPGNDRNGLRDSALNFTEDFHQIAQYYRNVLDWPVPSNRRWCRWCGRSRLTTNVAATVNERCSTVSNFAAASSARSPTRCCATFRRHPSNSSGIFATTTTTTRSQTAWPSRRVRLGKPRAITTRGR